MSDKEYYQQKLQAQLDEWKAELEKLKARAGGARADAKHEMSQHIEALEGQVERGKAKLSELLEASDDAWESIRDGVETSWKSLRSAFRDAASKFKD